MDFVLYSNALDDDSYVVHYVEITIFFCLFEKKEGKCIACTHDIRLGVFFL